MGVPHPGRWFPVPGGQWLEQHKAGAAPASECWGGSWNPPFIISPRFSDHLMKWFRGTIPTGAVGTPGKARNNLMVEVVSEVQHFVCSFICFQKRTAEMELNAASRISLTLNFGADKNTLAPPAVGQWFLMLGLHFYSYRRFCMKNLVSKS